MNLEDLHDVTKNLQPAPVPAANPWHNAAKRLSISKEHMGSDAGNSQVIDKSSTGSPKPDNGELDKDKENLSLVENGKKKERNEPREAKRGETSNGRRRYDNQRGGNGNGAYNNGNNNRRRNGNQNRNSNYTQNKNHAELDELNNVLEKTRRGLNAFNISVDNNNSHDNDGNFSETVSVDNDSREDNGYNNHNGNKNFRRKARNNVFNFSRNYAPPSSPQLQQQSPLSPQQQQQQQQQQPPLSPVAYANQQSQQQIQPPPPSQYNNAYLNQRRLSSPQFDNNHPMMMNPQFNPYIRYPIGYSPQGIQPSHMQPRIYYSPPMNENGGPIISNSHHIPMMISSNGMPIPIPMHPMMGYGGNPGYYRNEIGGIRTPSIHTPIIDDEGGSGGIGGYYDDGGEYYDGDRYDEVDEQIEEIISQIKYYFSTENLCKDMYLRHQMDKDGFIPISVIKKFGRIRTLTNGDLDIVDSVIDDIEEIEKRIKEDGDFEVRVKVGWEKWILKK